MSKVIDQPQLCPVCHTPLMLHEKACDDTARHAEQRRASEELDRLRAQVQDLVDEAWLDGKHNPAFDWVDATRLRAVLKRDAS